MCFMDLEVGGARLLCRKDWATVAAVRPRGIVSALISLLALAAAACAKTRSETEHSNAPPRSGSLAELAPPAPSVVLAGLSSKSIRARLETSEGAVHCELEPATAPNAVALFVGLA